MYTNVNLAAPIGALAFLGTGLLLFVTGFTLLYSILRRSFWLTKFAALTIAAVLVVYLAVLLIFSFASSEQVLARGEEKHFCEIDCHLATPSPTCAKLKSPTLLVREGELVTHLVIGHENSPLHKKTKFRI